MAANPNNAVTHPYLATVLVDTSSNWSKTYAAVGSLICMIDPPKMKRGKGKTSGLGNAGQAHTKKPGWIDSGQMKFSIKFNKTDMGTLFNFFVGDTDARYWKVRYNDGSGATTGSTEECLGFITEQGEKQFDEDTDDPITTDVTVELSGLVGTAAAT